MAADTPAYFCMLNHADNLAESQRRLRRNALRATLAGTAGLLLAFALLQFMQLLGQNEAREEAIADMLTKANAMAELAGVELGKLVFLTESGGGVPQSFSRIESVGAFTFASDQSTSILAGELDVNVNVQGVFAIAP